MNYEQLKSTLAQIDDELLAELLEAAQFALNDTRTAKRLSAELDIPVLDIKAQAHILIAASMWSQLLSPDISTVLDRCLQEELTGLGKLN